MGFPGSCEQCGAPRQWTLYAGVTFVRCSAGCLVDQRLFEGFDLPSDSEDPGYAFARSVEGLEPLAGGEVVPLEGDAARVNDRSKSAPSSPDGALPF